MNENFVVAEVEGSIKENCGYEGSYFSDLMRCFEMKKFSNWTLKDNQIRIEEKIIIIRISTENFERWRKSKK